MKHIILGITGATGAPIARRLLELLLLCSEVRLSVLMSDNAREVFRQEEGLDLGRTQTELEDALRFHWPWNDRAKIYPIGDMAAHISSGSNPSGGMIIAPCSMSTLGSIANGITMNLIHRSASVMLKEKRPLILVPRESPLSPVHLRNMLELSRIGVHVAPATTGFYNRPKSVADMVDFVCAKVLDLAVVRHDLNQRWTRKESFDESHQRIHRYLG